MEKRVLKDYENVSLKIEDEEYILDFEQLFGRKAPIHLEIGSGKGTFVLSEAKAQEDCDFICIEWANKFYKHAVDRIGRWGLTNVRIIRTDVAVFLPRHIPDKSISCFHIYFPDPWPKSRHHKRRFICGSNMDEMIRCLKKDGIVNIATDHAGYFEQIKEVVDTQVSIGRLETAEFIRGAGALENEVAGTNYERKYIKESRPIYTIAVRKP